MCRIPIASGDPILKLKIAWSWILSCLCLGMFLLFMARSANPAQSNLQFDVGGSRIEVVVNGDGLQLSQSDLMDWVHNAAESVTAYYGRFPTPHVLVQIATFDGTGVRNGRTF